MVVFKALAHAVEMPFQVTATTPLEPAKSCAVTRWPPSKDGKMARRLLRWTMIVAVTDLCKGWVEVLS